MLTTRLATILGAAVTLVVTTAGAAFAQPPAITSPVANQVFAAGPDYATDVLHDPWDFSNVDDVAPHPDDYLNWVESSGPSGARSIGPAAFLSAGRFKATSSTGDPMLGLLYQGTQATVVPERSGARYPIDTARYRKLAFRMKASNVPGGGSQSHVIWFFGPKPFSSATMGTAVSPVFTTNGERVYEIDLVNDFAQNTPYTTHARAVGLRLDPTGDAGALIEIDWVRLTASDASSAAAMMTVSAAGCSGSPSLAVIDGSGLSTIVDTSIPLGFNYGIFPPGAYQLELTCGGQPSPRVPFTINQPPRITVLQPDARGGVDFGAQVRGNPWDMDDAGDVVQTGNVDQRIVTPVPPGGLGSMLRGRNAFTAGRPDLTGDPGLYLMFGEGSGRPIASTRYRYLTFTTQLHHAFDLGLGSVARVLWASAANFSGAAPQTVTVTKDIVVWPGRNTYTIDLGALEVGSGLEPCAPNGACKPWTTGSPRFLRFDPHEFSDRQVIFDLDNVTLSAPDEVVQGQPFMVRWRLDDGDAGLGAYSATAYYAPASNPASRTAIAPPAAQTPNAVNEIPWSTAGIAPGDYVISVDITEQRVGMAGADVRVATSTGVLRVLPASNQPVVTIATHVTGGTTHVPFTLAGCAYNGATGTPADEVVVYAHPLQGQLGGAVQLLGHNAAGGFGTLAQLPASASCQFGGYQVTNVLGLPLGLWTFRVLARNTVTGDFDEVQAQNVMVEHRSAAPRNLRLESVSGNTVRVAWDPPGQGMPVRGYRIEASGTPNFTAISPVPLPPHVTTVTGTIGNGTYYIRVVAANDHSVNGIPSNVISFVLPGGGGVPGPPTAPGPPTLVATQVAVNPIVLSWSPGPGGAPAAYTLLAGTASGLSNLGVFPMGTATSVSAMAPRGRIYVRVIASNGGGNATSNEIDFAIAPPPAPTMHQPQIGGRNVTMSWTPAAGTPASRYMLIARYPGQQAVLVTLPTTNTSLFVPNAPAGTYIVTVVAINGAGTSAESNPITVVVQ